MKSARSVILFLLCIAIPFITGLAGSVFTAGSIPTWYTELAKPPFNPPNWVFGPIWTILYILMGISLYLVIKNGMENPLVRQGVVLFAIKPGANFLWSVLFFGMHAIFFAFLEIIFLFGLIAATMITFFRVTKPAGWLLVPHPGRVAVAAVLNAMIRY
jgi:tryptophan-rich sensory protein